MASLPFNICNPPTTYLLNFGGQYEMQILREAGDQINNDRTHNYEASSIDRSAAVNSWFPIIEN